jgi:hypothetical protein
MYYWTDFRFALWYNLYENEEPVGFVSDVGLYFSTAVSQSIRKETF